MIPDQLRLLHACSYAAAYFMAALVGLQFASYGGVGSPFWPSAGIALAALILAGPRYWPLFGAASFLAFATAGTDQSIAADLLIGMTNGASAALAAHVLRRARIRLDLARLADVMLLLLGAVGAAAFTASCGIVVLSAFAEISLRSMLETWISWFLGDFGGVLVAAPLLMTWREWPSFSRSVWWHLAACLAVTGVLSWMAFFESGVWRAWHVFLVLIWAALAFKVRGVSLAMSLVAVIAVASLVQGTGTFFELREYGPPIVFLQQFVSIATITMLVLSAVADERRGARELADARRRLGIIVDSAMDGIITVDNERRILVFNPAAEEIFACPAQEAIGQPIDRFIPERLRTSHADHMRRFRQTGYSARQTAELGTLSGLRANGEEFPLEASISHVKVGDEDLSTVILRDVSRRVAAEEARDLLAREVDHRAKNALAVVQAVVALTKAPTKEQYVEAVRGRISALSRAHSLLAQAKWEGADLAQLIHDELRPYGKSHEWATSGPLTFLTANSVQPFGLVIHELATNACKYGALCAGAGNVNVSWRVDASKKLRLNWVESGGPAVSAPQRIGFGSTLLREVATNQLGGEISFDWARGGLRVEIGLPQSAYRVGMASNANVADLKESAPDAPVSLESAGAPRVLVVEDETLVGMEMTDSLQRAGWEVVGPASTIESGIELAERPNLAVAVLDVSIHGRLVYPIADLLSRRGVPIVFCTGYQDYSAAQYENARIVRKPVQMDELMTVVNGAAGRAA